MEYAFYLGVDVDGDASISVVEKEAEDASADATYHVRHLERIELIDDEGKTPITDRIQDVLAQQPYTGRTVVVVNRTTGNGQVVLTDLNERGLTPLGIHLAVGEGAAQEGSGVQLEGGDDAAEDESSFFISEWGLADRLVSLHREGRLQLSQENTDEASILARGIQRYRSYLDEMEMTESAEAAGEAAASGASEETTSEETVEDEDSSPEVTETEEPEMEYDHITMSVALSCWLAEEHSFNPAEHLSSEIPSTGEVKRDRRPDIAN